MERIIAEKSPSLVNTALVAATTKVVQDRCLPEIAKRFRIPLGTGETEHELIDNLNHPLRYLVDGVIIAPLFEEPMHRLIPSTILGKHRRHVAAAVLSAAVFAYSHNITAAGGFETKKVPLHQFVGGLLYWEIMQDRGFKHALVAHATRNLVGHFLEHLERKTETQKAVGP